MRVKAALMTALLAASGVATAAQCRTFSLAGELAAGGTFKRAISPELSFRLEPSDFDAEDGWIFEIGPTKPRARADEASEFDHYVYALTPPYRFGNAQHVDTSYGVNAQDAVAATPRAFWFLVRRADGEATSEALNQVLWPQQDDGQARALAALAALPRGQGQFHILDSRITRGTAASFSTDQRADIYGEIHWLKFRVDLIVPASFPVLPKLMPRTGRCPADWGEWVSG